MNKENKVTSLKLSKKIHDKAREKGFELPESEYAWIVDNDTGKTTLSKAWKPFYLMECEKYSYYRAYDYKEVFDILNIDIPLDKITELAIMDIVNNKKSICKNNGKISKDTKDIIKSVIMERLNDWVEK